MELDIQKTILSEFRPYMEKPSARWKTTAAVLLALIGLGLYAFIRQHVDGHIITGMRDHVVWGVYIANFIYLLGISYACTIISCVFHLAHIKWGKPLMRILELIAFVTILIAPVYILLCIGRLDRLHYLLIHARIQSPIIWDVIAIFTDIIFCMVYLYMTHIKDFAKIRDIADEMNMANWRKKLYHKLAFGYNGTEEQERNLNRAMNIMAAIIIPTSIVAYSLLAWLFGMNLRPGWNSSIFAPQFVLTAVYSGAALILVIIWIYYKIYKLEKYINKQHFNNLGYGVLLLSLFFGYFTFSDFITNWYNSQNTTQHLLEKLTSSAHYGFPYVTSIILTMFLPIFILGIPRFRSINSMALVSVLILVGIWVNRYLLMVPVLETPYVPITDPRPEYQEYSATWVEWSLSIAGISFSLLLFMILSKFAPIIPLSELKEGKQIKFFYKSKF